MILDDIGPLGDMELALDISKKCYKYPPDTKEWIMKIMKEAHHTFPTFSDEKINTTITVLVFLEHWQQANEKVSSSFSGGHFGHYKAASFSKDSLALHAAKLTACGRKGIMLKRWTVGLSQLNSNIRHIQN
jgi:hypothetical protein